MWLYLPEDMRPFRVPSCPKAILLGSSLHATGWVLSPASTGREGAHKGPRVGFKDV